MNCEGYVDTASSFQRKSVKNLSKHNIYTVCFVRIRLTVSAFIKPVWFLFVALFCGWFWSLQFLDSSYVGQEQL